MDVEFSANLPQSLPEERQSVKRIELPILAYWGVSALLGGIFLRDWLVQWNVGATLSRPWLFAYLVVTCTIGQIIYFLVARHDARPVRWLPTAIFAVGNGVFETFAFALVYRLGETIGIKLGDLFLPSASSSIGLGLGVILFTIYGGSIHGLFWLRILPPHLNDSPLALMIRRYRLIAEIALVFGWCLCFWLTQDIWTVVFFHMIVDLGLMLRVRPVMFQNGSDPAAAPASNQT